MSWNGTFGRNWGRLGMICKLGTLASVKGGKRLPKGINLISTPNSHPYIRVRDLNNQRTLELNSHYEFVDNETQKQIERYVVHKGDIVLSIVGTIGLVAIVGKSLDNANLTENCVKITVSEKINNEFLYYYLKSHIGQAEIIKGTVGAVQAKLPIKNIQDINVWVPQKNIQTKIASVLSCIDDKIELNNKINTNLQEQAQAIFKSWFVDFEPFQDGEFMESELGLIPKGWRVGTLSELITIKYGKAHKKLLDGTYPAFGSGGIMRYVECPIYTKESVLIPRKGTLNNVIYLNEPFWTVDTMFYTEMKVKYIAKYIYHFLLGMDLASMNAGSAVPSMTTDILNSLKTIIPTENWLKRFEDVVNSFYIKMSENKVESERLSQIQGALLPKLMNGEIEINGL